MKKNAPAKTNQRTCKTRVSGILGLSTQRDFKKTRRRLATHKQPSLPVSLEETRRPRNKATQQDLRSD